MKSVVTSFSMNIRDAVTIDEATRNVANRSAWIVDACLRKARAQDEFDIATVPTRQLMAALHARPGDISEHLREMLLFELAKVSE